MVSPLYRDRDRLSSSAAVQRYCSTGDFKRFDDRGVVVEAGAVPAIPPPRTRTE